MTCVVQPSLRRVRTLLDPPLWTTGVRLLPTNLQRRGSLKVVRGTGAVNGRPSPTIVITVLCCVLVIR
jgi:hypothetical protein